MTDDNSPLYLTTAIPYVNAPPHIGHAFELFLADAKARHQRQRGRRVYLTGGTDDHSLKNARAAARRGVSTAALVATNGATFRRLPDALDVRLDDYLHTSSDPRHEPAVRELWRRCAEHGDLYASEYSGRYCTGCEAFVPDEEASDGLCPTHRERLEFVSERNWFFRLSRYQQPLLSALESGALRIVPTERYEETVRFVRGGLSDFSVSRSRARARGWGLTVPDDPTQVVYVWYDALASYLSQLGFPKHEWLLNTYWTPASAERAHLIGKDILRFHAVYWPAILTSAGLPLPSCLFVHGHLTAHGHKIGKSSGNTVDPFELVERFGIDAVRFYCLRHLHSCKDSDFQIERLIEAHDADLAGKLGNLLHRACALGLRHPDLALRRHGRATSEADEALRNAARRAALTLDSAFAEFAIHRAASAIVEFVSEGNRYAEEQQPWTLSRRAVTAKSALARHDLECQLSHVLWHLFETLRVSAVLLEPLLPNAARRIASRLGIPLVELENIRAASFGRHESYRVRSGPPLFPRLSGGEVSGSKIA